MAYNRDITAADKVFFDTDQLLRFTIYQGNPTIQQILAKQAIPQDVNGWTLSWTLRKEPKTELPLLLKTIGAGIEITGNYDVNPDNNTQRVDVTLEDTDTFDPTADPPVVIKPGTYAFALKRLDEGEETILTWGSFELLQAAGWEEE